jgi:Iron-containing redox enzyme
LFDHLRRGVHEIPVRSAPLDDPIVGDDSALALYVLYELHYRSFVGVDEGWEWDPSLLRVRAQLEERFLGALLAKLDVAPTGPEDVVARLQALASADDGPSLSAHMESGGMLEELREFAIHRSAYQLKEADPHTWAIPRISGRAKAALVDIQMGEYGDGRPEAVHSTLFATTMDVLGLDSRYGAYLDFIPGTTLATVNLVSMFGLHRRWRAALLGHLALFEMCSVVPMGRYASALRRFGLDAGVEFYDAHVVADARHEVVALYDMVGSFAADEPELASQIVFGARALAYVERVFATSLLAAWRAGRTSLRSHDSNPALFNASRVPLTTS